MAISQRTHTFKGGVGTTEFAINWTWTSSLNGFKTARNQVYKDLKYMMRDTANRKVVPHVDARAHFVRTITHQGVVAKSGRGNSVYITTDKGGKLRRAVGYIEFGGENPGKERKRLLLAGELTPRVVGVSREGHLVGPKMSGKKRRRSRTNRAHAGAVMTPQGPRAFINKPRKFRGKGLMQQGVQETEGAYSKALMGEMLTYFEREGFYVNR